MRNMQLPVLDTLVVLQVRLQQQLQRQKPTPHTASFSAHAHDSAATAAAPDGKVTHSTSAVPQLAQASSVSLHAHSKPDIAIRPSAAVPPPVPVPAPAKQAAATKAPLMQHQSQSTSACQAVSTAGGSSSRHDDGAKQSGITAVGVKLPQPRPAENSLYSVSLLLSDHYMPCCCQLIR